MDGAADGARGFGRADAACRLAQTPGSAKVLVYEESAPALADMLRDMKVDFGQGYGLHKPEPLKTLCNTVPALM